MQRSYLGSSWLLCSSCVWAFPGVLCSPLFACFNPFNMTIKFYGYHHEELVKDYLLAGTVVPYASIIAGIVFCKMAYDLSQLLCSYYIKAYASLNKFQSIEWNNRAMSSAHAIFITVMSAYLVFFSNLYSHNQVGDPISFRSSPLSTFVLGVSIGYFITDLAMIYWLFPSLGGMEYVFHHSLSILCIGYTMLSGEAQLYTYIVLISEATTPAINMRWFLDAAGMKRSYAYLVNGVVMVFGWLVARILLFIYFFYCVYLHYDEIKQIHVFGYVLLLVVPVILSIMNMMWFMKILNGLKKTVAKRH